jgi:hypothetical protein
MKPVMRKMSSQLIVSAVASTLAMAAFALTAPAAEHGARSGASMVPVMAELPAPPALPSLLR